jgi:diaminopimelate epimerase
MQVRFTKMHGLGNDFVVFDAISTPLSLTVEQLRFLADRRFGIGCDQLLLVEASTIPGVDFRYRIFNADGQEVQQCGNGARCFARFVRDKGLTTKDKLVVETQAGLIYPRIQPNGEVIVNMGVPRFLPSQVPFYAEQVALQYPIVVGADTYHVGVVSIGNPHAVLMVDSVDTAPVATVGAQLTCHLRFPECTNVGFMQLVDSSHIRLRVYERGVGETLACGTGACAAVVVGRRLERLDTPVTVELPGGQLYIEWAGEEAPVWMTGPAVHVFEGMIEL